MKQSVMVVEVSTKALSLFMQLLDTHLYIQRIIAFPVKIAFAVPEWPIENWNE